MTVFPCETVQEHSCRGLLAVPLFILRMRCSFRVYALIPSRASQANARGSPEIRKFGGEHFCTFVPHDSLSVLKATSSV